MSANRSELLQLSRRDFLKSSGLAVGGLVIGVSIPLGALGKPGARDFTPNAFVHIAETGDTTVYCGRCELGQGVSTALPAAVADELEADWSRVRVLQGDGDEEKFGPQATGGSRSIKLMFEPMRKAGAAGKEMLLAAAAQTWGLPVGECYADEHVIHNRKDNRRLGYGELAGLAGQMPVPENPVLKSRQDFRYIGKSLPRHDQDEIVAGTRVYGADVKLPGMKYGAIRHVPVYGGSLKSVDKAEALAMPGVVEVVEIPRFENLYGSQGGVAVVADNTWTAQQAVRQLKIEWEPGKNGAYDTEQYKAALAATVEAPAETVFEKGDLDQAFKDARTTHGATFMGSHLSHSPIEPMASCAWVTADSCEIWASTQDPQSIQKTIGAYLERDPQDITVHVMMTGGAFGRKFKCDYVQEAVALSKAVGSPVQLTWSREEDMRTGYYHSCSAQRIEACVDAEGKVSGWLHRAAFPPIAATLDPSIIKPSADDMSAVSDHPYGIGNMRVESGSARAHTRIGWFRSVYAIFYSFAINVFTDELAHKAGVDSLEFFRGIYDSNRNPEQKEQVLRCRAVLDKAAEMAGWGRDMPDNHGLGIAMHHSFASYVAIVVHAEVDGDDIKVHRVDCAADCGLVVNPDNATAQIEGAVIMGLDLALNTGITFRDGAVVNSNFHDYPVMRISEAPPEINVAFIGQDNNPTGIGEPGVPTTAPALINAIHAASGKRYRSLPIRPA
jgi:isoquinoline 1-oxidoreductase beta subunit